MSGRTAVVVRAACSAAMLVSGVRSASAQFILDLTGWPPETLVADQRALDHVPDVERLPAASLEPPSNVWDRNAVAHNLGGARRRGLYSDVPASFLRLDPGQSVLVRLNANWRTSGDASILPSTSQTIRLQLRSTLMVSNLSPNSPR